MFVVMNRFTLNPGMHEAFEQRWKDRESLLSTVPGFVKFRLLRGDDTHYSSYVEWDSEQDFEAWTTSEAFRQSHAKASTAGTMAGPPKLECWHVILDGA